MVLRKSQSRRRRTYQFETCNFFTSIWRNFVGFVVSRHRSAIQSGSSCPGGQGDLKIERF